MTLTRTDPDPDLAAEVGRRCCPAARRAGCGAGRGGYPTTEENDHG